MENFDANQTPGDEGKPPVSFRSEPFLIAVAVAVVVSLVWFVSSPDYDSLIGVFTAVATLLPILWIKNKRINWLLIGVLVATAVVGFIIVIRANDPEKIVIVGINFDGSNVRESDEYVVIRNEDTEPIQLEGWALNDDRSNHVFTFPRYEIQPDQECRIYTNESHPETCGFSFGSGGSGVWNNDGDIATLRNAEGKLIDESTEQISPASTETVRTQIDIPEKPSPTLPAEFDDLACIPRNTPREAGLVVGVIDGRTIDVHLGDGSIVRVRYLGVATIVEGRPLFEQSVGINKELVLGQQVTLVEDTNASESEDILQRYVFVEDIFVNHRLVASGYAVADGDSSCLEHFINMEVGASELDLGFYGDLADDSLSDLCFEDAQDVSDNIVITDIFYDGVKGSAEPDEYVEIQNQGAEAIQLVDWTLSDEANHTFVFRSFIIKPGQSCRIYTNEIHPEWCSFNYGTAGSAIWSNKGDCARLRDPGGSLVDEFCY